MAIVSVSRIQHRRGLTDDLPQLASGELGWAIDSRRLFVGNGSETEGAPEEGNTEILTVYSDIMDLLDTYTYRGARAGYDVSTGPAGSPIVRTFQDKLDDIVNVRDFGAKGDGVTDDTVAINRALFELFCRNINPSIRRALYFSAGTYVISDAIKIPTYATILGEGLECVIIQQSDMNFPCVKLADSLQQIDVNNGSGAGVSSRYIDINDVSFKLARPAQTVPDGSTVIETDVVMINTAQSVRFNRVGFIGYRNFDSDIGTAMDNRSGLKLNYTGAEGIIVDILCDNCEFRNLTYAASMDEDISHIRILNSRFYHLYAGVKVGENTVSIYPKGINFQLNNFDKVYTAAITTYTGVNDVTSGFNTYRDVGNGLIGEAYASPAFPVLDFAETGCTSLCDYFARSDEADRVTPRVEMNGASMYIVRPRTGITSGNVTLAPGGSATLSDNIPTPTTTSISLDVNVSKSADFVYQIIRGAQVRHGKVTLVQDTANQSFNDIYLENNGDIGVNLSLSYSANVTSLFYTTTATGNAATMHYQMRYIA